MESLQLAQMLADLSDLNAAQEAKAALAVVEANKTLSPAPASDTSAHAAASSNMPTDQAHPAPRQRSEDDIARATSLMQLYDIRAKLKQQDNSAALAKARERISALHARQQQIHSPSLGGGHTTPDVPQSRFTYPKSSA
jgi:hypothetical protein